MSADSANFHKQLKKTGKYNQAAERREIKKASKTLRRDISFRSTLTRNHPPGKALCPIWLNDETRAQIAVGEKGRGVDKAGADKTILAREGRGPFSRGPEETNATRTAENGERREKAADAHAGHTRR